MEQEVAWHRPTFFRKSKWVHVTGTCYEHRSWIGTSPERMNRFTRDLLRVFRPPFSIYAAWCVLPNHYHVLAELRVPDQTRKEIGQLHGRTSHRWNVEDDTPGRKCFHGCRYTPIKSEAHWWSTLNDIHHNPVKHKLVDSWTEWSHSSAKAYLGSMPRDSVKAIWDHYPITDMGRGWDW